MRFRHQSCKDAARERHTLVAPTVQAEVAGTRHLRMKLKFVKHPAVRAPRDSRVNNISLVAYLRILASAPALLLLISCASAQPATVSLQSLLDTGKYAEAEQAANAALSAQSNDVRARMALGEAYAATGRYKQAITEFEQASATASGPDRLRSELRRGELLELT